MIKRHVLLVGHIAPKLKDPTELRRSHSNEFDQHLVEGDEVGFMNGDDGEHLCLLSLVIDY
jgi:hypothetical protein